MQKNEDGQEVKLNLLDLISWLDIPAAAWARG